MWCDTRMEESIQDLHNKVKLTDKEASGVLISKGATDKEIKNGSFSLVGKIFASRYFGGDVVTDATRRAWMVTDNVDFRAAGGNVFFFFFFHFENRMDLLKAKKEGPWHIDQNLLALEVFDRKLSPS